MANVSKPLLGLLVATVLFLALWVLALRPHGSASGASGATPYQPAISAAKNVQHVVDSASAKAGGTPAASAPAPPSSPAAGSPAPATASPAPAATSSGTAARPKHHARTVADKPPAATRAATTSVTAADRLNAAAAALKAGRVLALLFYNPGGADDIAVKQELATISSHRGQVVKLAVPLNELPSYAVVTSQVPVNFAPTLVIVDAAKRAQELAGFADSYEISQRITDALAVKP